MSRHGEPMIVSWTNALSVDALFDWCFTVPGCQWGHFSKRILVLVVCSVTGMCLPEVHAQSQEERPIVTQQVQYPHSSGYQLGDTFEHLLSIEIRRPYKLVVDSLPSVGRVSAYIALQDVRVDQSIRLKSRVYKIALQYQVINYDDSLVGTSVPPALVTFATDTDVYPVVVERWGLTLSPFLMKTPRNPGSMPVLEELAYITRVPLWPKVISGLLLLLGGAVLLLPTIRKQLIDPLSQRRNRPFIRAHREMSRLNRQRSSASLEKYLRCLHGAFNKKMGRTVLSEDVDAFLLQYPAFEASRDSILRFFEISDLYFFANDRSVEEKRNISLIKALVAAMRRVEWREVAFTADDPVRNSRFPQQGMQKKSVVVRHSTGLLKP